MVSPDRLSHAKRRLSLSRPVPFSYDYVSGNFTFGSEVVAPQDIPEYGVPYGVGEAELPDGAIEALFATTPMVYTYRAPISLPLFQDYIRDNWTNDLAEETMRVMADLMPEARARKGSSSLRRSGFGAVRAYNSSDGQGGRVQLEVPGSCACLGPDATTPGWGSQFWGEGIMDYSYHNIDRPVQRVALMAGLGHVGHLASVWAQG